VVVPYSLDEVFGHLNLSRIGSFNRAFDCSFQQFLGVVTAQFPRQIHIKKPERRMPGLPGSVLGNPFRIGRDGTRDQVIAKYRRWLWEQIKLKNEAYVELRRIAELARRGDITLICWCAPELCHATVIERSVEYLNAIGG
jgi:hypothetical protein